MYKNYHFGLKRTHSFDSSKRVSWILIVIKRDCILDSSTYSIELATMKLDIQLFFCFSFPHNKSCLDSTMRWFFLNYTKTCPQSGCCQHFQPIIPFVFKDTSALHNEQADDYSARRLHRNDTCNYHVWSLLH